MAECGIFPPTWRRLNRPSQPRLSDLSLNQWLRLRRVDHCLEGPIVLSWAFNGSHFTAGAAIQLWLLWEFAKYWRASFL
jgi:hypothetical protein